jgi:hypothetical protein
MTIAKGFLEFLNASVFDGDGFLQTGNFVLVELNRCLLRSKAGIFGGDDVLKTSFGVLVSLV